MTEVGVNCFTMTVEESFRKPGSIGKPMLFTEVKLEQMDGDPGSEIGEMWIRGPHVSLGYWNNEAATRASYSDDGWFRTGDLARRDADGFFYIAGRRKEMFISGGVNVYPAEIEAELVSHPRRVATPRSSPSPTTRGAKSASRSSSSTRNDRHRLSRCRHICSSGWQSSSCRATGSSSTRCRGPPPEKS